MRWKGIQIMGLEELNYLINSDVELKSYKENKRVTKDNTKT